MALQVFYAIGFLLFGWRVIQFTEQTANTLNLIAFFAFIGLFIKTF